ncbi:5-deoxy-glucuronate isomerase [Terrabacter sp. GCM10028922]|uniref:5-deoxy-glucuronate isomerase n=1 Tax=Terrabacter sp. GCM10028922 TaxID=3273428 RepID=UPI00361A4CA1
MTWHRPFGTVGGDGWDVVVEPDASGWEHTGMYAGRLADGESRGLDAGRRELVVVPLEGSVLVSSDDAAGRHEATLAGRASVFAGATDVAYVPAGSRLSVTAVGAARVALVFAVTETVEPRFAFRHVAADEVPVELRGAGFASREVRNFGIPGVLEADSIIACEVVTPAGNWSSWPPHKHDEERPGEETQLEEIYYFEVAPEDGSPASAAADPIGYQRVYGTEHRPIDVMAEVRSGDVVLVPHGWHGPAMAAPGYDLYYLNVMAGPGPERAWLICDDPAHGWVRDTWSAQPVDPRLPLGGSR